MNKFHVKFFAWTIYHKWKVAINVRHKLILMSSMSSIERLIILFCVRTDFQLWLSLRLILCFLLLDLTLLDRRIRSIASLSKLWYSITCGVSTCLLLFFFFIHNFFHTINFSMQKIHAWFFIGNIGPKPHIMKGSNLSVDTFG